MNTDKIKNVQPDLHKADVSGTLAFLAQLQKEEDEAARTTSSYMRSERHYKNCRDIESIIWLIKRRAANAR